MLRQKKGYPKKGGMTRASIQITLDTYSHVAPGLQEAAANRFDDIIISRKSEVK